MSAVDYDRREARPGPIVAASAAVLGLLVVMIVGVFWLYTVTVEKVDQEVYSGAPAVELRAIHEREDQNLHRYGYIDKGRGVVRVPVRRAMELVEQEAAAGKPGYNTKSYPAKVEPLGGAAAAAAVK
jgi:hypothetical protein